MFICGSLANTFFTCRHLKEDGEMKLWMISIRRFIGGLLNISSLTDVTLAVKTIKTLISRQHRCQKINKHIKGQKEFCFVYSLLAQSKHLPAKLNLYSQILCIALCLCINKKVKLKKGESNLILNFHLRQRGSRGYIHLFSPPCPSCWWAML